MEFNLIIALSFLFIPIGLFVYQLFFGHLLKDKTWYVSVIGIGINVKENLHHCLHWEIMD